MYHSLIQVLAAARLIGRESGATLAELADHLGLGKRSVYRLLESLDELGYPYFKDGEHGNRYKLVNPGYPPARWLPIPPVELDLEDRIMLDWLFDMAKTKAGFAEPLKKLRRKLDLAGAISGYALAPKDSGAGAPPRSIHLIHAATLGKAVALKEDKWIGELMRAIEEHRVCSVSYESRESGTVNTYPIHPLAVFESEDSPYAYVELPYSGAIRILALERIRALSVTSEEFEAPKDFNAEGHLADPFGIVQGEEITAVLLFTEEQAPYVKERAWPESYRFSTRPDGSLEMRLTPKSLFGLKRWILGWGEDVEVLEPAFLRHDLARTIMSMTDLYPDCHVVPSP